MLHFRVWLLKFMHTRDNITCIKLIHTVRGGQRDDVKLNQYTPKNCLYFYWR